MSLKNAIVGLPFGGGKAVVLLEPGKAKSAGMLRAFERFVNSLRGSYITAEDVGTTVADMEIVSSESPFVGGLPERAVAGDGNPAPKTALGVYLGIQAAVRFKLGRHDLERISIAVHGLGGVGYELCRLLAADGASLRVADVRLEAVDRVCKDIGANAVSVESVLLMKLMYWRRVHWVGFSIARRFRACGPRSLPVLRTINLPQKQTGSGCLLQEFSMRLITCGQRVPRRRYTMSIEQEIQKIPERLTEIFWRAQFENRSTSACANDMAHELLRLGPSGAGSS